jgi:hypothetical protein
MLGASASLVQGSGSEEGTASAVSFLFAAGHLSVNWGTTTARAVALPLQPVDQRGHITRSKTIVDIHHADIRRAGIHHPQ